MSRPNWYPAGELPPQGLRGVSDLHPPIQRRAEGLLPDVHPVGVEVNAIQLAIGPGFHFLGAPREGSHVAILDDGACYDAKPGLIILPELKVVVQVVPEFVPSRIR